MRKKDHQLKGSLDLPTDVKPQLRIKHRSIRVHRWLMAQISCYLHPNPKIEVKGLVEMGKEQLPALAESAVHAVLRGAVQSVLHGLALPTSCDDVAVIGNVLWQLLLSLGVAVHVQHAQHAHVHDAPLSVLPMQPYVLHVRLSLCQRVLSQLPLLLLFPSHAIPSSTALLQLFPSQSSLALSLLAPIFSVLVVPFYALQLHHHQVHQHHHPDQQNILPHYLLPRSPLHHCHRHPQLAQTTQLPSHQLLAYTK